MEILENNLIKQNGNYIFCFNEGFFPYKVPFIFLQPIEDKNGRKVMRTNFDLRIHKQHMADEYKTFPSYS